jgi:hypothetical protein
VRSHRLSVTLLGLAALGLVATSTPQLLAQSAPSPQQIKEAAGEFDLGIKAAQNGDFETAASHFESADRLAPSADALKAAIRARRDAKQGARAATLAAIALARYPDNKELASFADGAITALAPDLHKVTVTCKPACLLVVDQRLVPGEASAAGTLYLDPGEHTVSAGWGQKSAVQKVTAAAAGSSALSFTPPADEKKPLAAPPASAAPPPSSAPPPEAPPPRNSGLPPAVAYGGIALTAVLGGVSIWSGFDTKSNPGPDAVKQLCVGKGPSCPEYQDGLSSQRRTNIFLAATGGVAVVTGVVALLFTDWKGGSDAPARSTGSGARPLKLVPNFAIGREGATLTATGQF